MTGRCPAILLLLMLAVSAYSQTGGQIPDSTARRESRLFRYEFQKKDKAEGLAWSLLVPGGAVFYSGRRPELGASLAFVEALSLGTILYNQLQSAGGHGAVDERAMTNVFIVVFLAAKVYEVCEGFSLIDDNNLELWKTLSASPEAAAPVRPGLAPEARGVQVRISIPL